MGASMKAIILAAGQGRRLKHLTRDLPKCLAVVLDGKTLLRTQLDALKACGINDIALVRGHQADKIRVDGLRYYLNEEYASNNILASLFSAEEELDGDVLVSYSDIWYDEALQRKIAASRADLALGVDVHWQAYYEGRREHSVAEAENVVFDSAGRLLKIGKIGAEMPVDGEFVGMMKLSAPGCELLKRHYHRVRELHEGKSFQRADLFKNAYLTDLLQEMVDRNVSIHCEAVDSTWKEIDTLEDVEKAQAYFKQRQQKETR